MPLDPRLQLAEQLGLALASIYLKPEQLANLQKASIAAGAIGAALELFRQATGRPAGWRPSPEEWEVFIGERDRIIAAEEAKVAALPPPAEPTG